MTSRPRARWLLERLATFLLCLCIAGAYQLWQTLEYWHVDGGSSFLTGGPLSRNVAHLHFNDAPLEEVINEISRQTGQKITVDWDDLATYWGETRHSDTTIHVDNVKLSAALFETFQPSAHSPWRIHVSPHDGIWVHTFHEGKLSLLSAPSQVVVRNYDVRDLLQPFSDAPDHIWLQQGLFGGSSSAPVPSSERHRALDELISLLQDQLVPPRTATFSVLGGRLVVVAPSDQQDRIAAILRALRVTMHVHEDDSQRPGQAEVK